MAQSVGAVALDIVMGRNTVTGVVRSAMHECQSVISNSSSTMAQKVGAIGNAMQGVGKAVMPASTVVGGLGTAAVKTAAKFDSAMAKVAAVSGATGDDLERLRDKAKEMGEKTKFSASESAEAMNYMAMAGWKTEDMLSGISGIMNLAAASGEDLATTSDIVTDALTAFGLSAQDSGRFADILAAASSNANTNVSMMGETFKYVAPVAGAMGYKAEDMAVAIGLMANSGIKASQAGTALRSSISRLVKPTDEVEASMQAYGISLTDANGNVKTFDELMRNLRSSLGGMSEAQQAQAAASLFGQEAMSGMLAIVNASEDDFNKLTNAVNNCDGTSQKMADTMNNNLNGKLTLLKSQIEGVAIKIGEQLIPIVSKVVDGISKAVDWFSNLDEGTRQMIVRIGLFVAAAGPVLIVGGKIVSAIGSIMKVGKVLKSGLVLLKGAIAGISAPVLAVVAVIGVLVGAFIYLWNTNEEFRNNIIAIWEGIKAKFEEFGQGIVDRLNALGFDFENFGEVIKAVWDAICSVLAPAFEGAFAAVAAVLGTALDIITGIFDFFSGIFTGNWELAWQGIGEIFGGIWNGIVGIFSAAMDTLIGVADAILGWFGTTWNDTVQGIGDFFTGIWNGIVSTIVGIKDAVVNGVTGAIDWIKALPGQAVQWGKDMIQGLIDGIKNMIDGVGDAVKGVADKITSFLHFSVPDEGPLTDYESWMPDFMGGLAKGIKDSQYLVTDAVGALSTDMAVNPVIAPPQLKNVPTGGYESRTAYMDGRKDDGETKDLLRTVIELLKQDRQYTIPVYIGADLLDEQTVKADRMRALRSGGKA